MKKILGTTLVLIVLALVARAQVNVVDRPLDGVAVDPSTGDPVPFATVTLSPFGDAGAASRALTDAAGRFRFSGLLVGHRYRLEVSAHGYHPVREGLEVLGGSGPIRARVLLHPADGPAPSAPCLVLTAAAVRLIPGRELSRPGERPLSGKSEADLDLTQGTSAPGSPREVAESLARGYATRQQWAAPPGTGPGLADGAISDAALERIAADSDELWILERPAAGPGAQDGRDPGTGCLVVIEEDDREVPVPLEHTDVHARIDGYVASVDLRQRFHNPFGETIEAEYLFPLPEDAAVNDFVMTVGQRRIRGIIREKEEARELYERARRAGHVASLLEQERPNIFRQRVANIEPGHAIEVELHYFNALPYRDGEFVFSFPLVVGPRFNPPGSADPIGAVPRGAGAGATDIEYLAPGERSGHDVDITVELDAGLDLVELHSPSHSTRIDREGRQRALIRLAANDRIPNRDFVLGYRVARETIASGMLVHREGEDGYFSLMLVPPASLEDLEREPAEFVFVLDCSGSMRGWPMQKAKSAMRRALRQLRPGDSFQVVRFSEQASALGPAPVEATEANVRRGLDYVDALEGSGGTMMIEGIKAALDFPHDPERTRVVSFMTDGFIGNEAEIFAAVSERLRDTRVFSFGVGNSVNRYLVEGLARMGRGAVAYIGLDDDLAAVDDFYRIVRHPALTDISIDWGAMEAEQVFPQRVHDLFVGRPVLLHGRFAGSGRTTVTVRGRAGGRAVVMPIEVDLGGDRPRRALPLLWARSEIRHISDRLAQEPDASLRSRGLDLALDYNLVSDWTSFVAVDASTLVDDPSERTEKVPVPVPDGVEYETTVGGQGR